MFLKNHRLLQQDVSPPPPPPSQILPPLRDLQPFFEQSLSALVATPFHKTRGTTSTTVTTAPPRPDAFAQDFPPVFGLASRSGLPNNDRRAAESSYVGASVGSGLSILQASHPPYPYPPVIHKTDSEQLSSSRQIPPQHHQSNFGIIADAIDPKAKLRRANLPKPVTDILRAWFHEHLDHLYPSEGDKQMFMTRTGLSTWADLVSLF